MKKQKSTTKYRNFIDQVYNTEGIRKKPKGKFKDLKIDPDCVSFVSYYPSTRMKLW